MLDVFLISLRIDEYIIQVNYYKFSKMLLQDKIHESLKGSWCVAQFKWHSEVFILSLRHYECGLMDILLSNLDLPISCD